MFEYKNGVLFWYNFDLSTLAENFSTPLHVIHSEAVEASVTSFMTPFQKEKLPIEPHVSVKTNPIPELLLLFKEHNIQMDVISDYELQLVQRLGFSGEDIIVNGAGKSRELIAQAWEHIAKLVSLWSLNDFRICQELSFENSAPLNVEVRMCPTFSSRFSNLQDPRPRS